MALTLSTRLGLTLWGLGSDPYNRAQRQAAHEKLDDLVAIDRQGVLLDRPAAAAANRGMFWTLTDTADAGVTHRSDGTTWRPVNGVLTTYQSVQLATVADAAALTSGGTDGGYVREAIVAPAGANEAASPMLVGLWMGHNGPDGAQATIDVWRRGGSGDGGVAAPAAVLGFTGLIAARKANSYYVPDADAVPLFIGDRLHFRVTGVNGTVTDLRVALIIRHRLKAF